MAGVVDSLGVQPAFTMVTLLTQASIEGLSTTKSIFALTLKYDRIAFLFSFWQKRILCMILPLFASNFKLLDTISLGRG